MRLVSTLTCSCVLAGKDKWDDALKPVLSAVGVVLCFFFRCLA